MLKLSKLQILKERMNKNIINLIKDKKIKAFSNSVSWSWAE